MQNQMEAPLLGDLKREIKNIDRHLIASCRTMAGALRVCMSRSHYNKPDHWFAEQIGMDASHFSQCLKINQKQPKHMPPTKTGELMGLCGNRAPAQWLDLYSEGELDMQREALSKEEQIKELEQQIMALKTA